MDREFRTAFVYVRDSFAGALRETDAGYEFQYDADYLSNPDAPGGSLTLPPLSELMNLYGKEINPLHHRR